MAGNKAIHRLGGWLKFHNPLKTGAVRVILERKLENWKFGIGACTSVACARRGAHSLGEVPETAMSLKLEPQSPNLEFPMSHLWPFAAGCVRIATLGDSNAEFSTRPRAALSVESRGTCSGTGCPSHDFSPCSSGSLVCAGEPESLITEATAIVAAD